MEPFHEEAVMRAVTAAYRERIDFDVRWAEMEGWVYVDFRTPHPGFLWSNPDNLHALEPATFIIDSNTGEVQGGHYIAGVTAFKDLSSLPWREGEDDGTSVHSESYTLVCNASLLYTNEGADELQRFLQDSLGEVLWIGLSGFPFRS